MKVINQFIKRLFNKELEIVTTQKGNQKSKQSIILRNEKIVNAPTQNLQPSISEQTGITHKVVLAINEKLSVYGIGEVASYDFNNNGELVMDLSLYKHKVHINPAA